MTDTSEYTIKATRVNPRPNLRLDIIALTNDLIEIQSLSAIKFDDSSTKRTSTERYEEHNGFVEVGTDVAVEVKDVTANVVGVPVGSNGQSMPEAASSTTAWLKRICDIETYNAAVYEVAKMSNCEGWACAMPKAYISTPELLISCAVCSIRLASSVKAPSVTTIRIKGPPR